MKKSHKFVTTRTAEELAKVLRLSKEDALEMEMRSELTAKIIDVVRRKELTHIAVAKLAHTSRTRITALLNGNTRNVSTSLLIRILASLGVKTKLSYSSFKIAA